MRIIDDIINFSTKGYNDIINITDEIRNKINQHNIKSAIINVFVPGATGGLTTVEYEPGLISDLKDFFEKIIPYKYPYKHHNTWGDNNGGGHVRASLLGPSLSLQVTDGNLQLGTWQNIIFIDFDTGSRKRNIILKMIGE